MTADDLTRFEALLDRELGGQELTEPDRQFLDDYLRTHPEAAREAALLCSLSDLDAAPDEDSRALVDLVMDELRDPGQNDAPTEALSTPAGLGTPAVRRMAVATAAAAVLGIGAWTLLLPTGRAPVATRETPQPTAVAGRLELVYSSGQAHVGGDAARAGAELLREGDVVKTGDGSACFVLDPGIDVCLDAASELRVTRINEPERVLTLEAGRVSLRLDKQPAGSSIAIEAAGVRSTAVGTAYSVRVDGADDDATVATTVMEGVVRVSADASAHRVGAHERVTIDRVDGVRRQALSRSEEGNEWGALSARQLWHGEVSGQLRIDSDDRALGGAQVWLDGRPIGQLPLSSLVPVGLHSLIVRDGDRVLLEQDVDVRAGQPEQIRVIAPELPAVEEAPPAPPSRGATVRSPTELLSGARHMMMEARWEDAAEMYRALRRRHPRSEEAHTVLVSLAQLELDRLGRPGKALSLLDGYLASGGGALSQEARYTRIRALRRLKLVDAERDAIAVFLDAHPKSFHARRLRARLDELGTP